MSGSRRAKERSSVWGRHPGPPGVHRAADRTSLLHGRVDPAAPLLLLLLALLDLLPPLLLQLRRRLLLVLHPFPRPVSERQARVEVLATAVFTAVAGCGEGYGGLVLGTYRNGI